MHLYQTMKSLVLSIILFFTIVCKIQSQDFSNAIVEVYIDSTQTFDYSIQIISKGDTITPGIIGKYFLPSLKLETFVTLIINHKNHRIIVPYVEKIFLSHWSYIKINISSVAEDECVYYSFHCFDMIDNIVTYCELFHSLSFRKYDVYTHEEFYKNWEKKKLNEANE